MNQHDEIMTLAEIATYLKVSEKTVIRMAQVGDIPCAKIASQWRFVKDIIDDWIYSRMNTMPDGQLKKEVESLPDNVPLSSLISSDLISMDISPGDKRHVLKQLMTPLLTTGQLDDGDSFLDKLMDREDMISTGIGHGFAVPHVRDAADTGVSAPSIIIGICKEGTDFNSLDGKPTHVFAMPCARSAENHLRLMANISLVFRRSGVLKEILSANTAKEVMAIFCRLA